MTQVSKEREWYGELFSEFERGLNGASEMPLHKIRRDAMRWFSENGFPTIRQEEWRFTNVSPISNTAFKMNDSAPEKIGLADIQPFLIDEKLPRLVFVNGLYVEALSKTDNLPRGVVVENLQNALASARETVTKNLARHAKIDENGFVALNTAFMQHGAFIHFAKNIDYETPIHLLYLATANAAEHLAQPRNLIVAENNAEVAFVESYAALSDAVYFTNPVTEVVVGENTVLHHYKIQQESAKAFHTALLQIYQQRNSTYVSHNYVFGGAIARNDLNTMLDGEGVECTLNGLYLAGGKRLVDNHSVISHAKPHGNSRELYKGILDEQARAVFSGKICVYKDAQKTDAIQSNQNLVLSEEATIDTKPQLEIFADDVRCTHGGTVGQMNEDGLFYLRARGISQDSARNMLIQAFAGEVADRIKHEVVREHVDAVVAKHLVKGHLKS